MQYPMLLFFLFGESDETADTLGYNPLKSWKCDLGMIDIWAENNLWVRKAGGTLLLLLSESRPAGSTVLDISKQLNNMCGR